MMGAGRLAAPALQATDTPTPTDTPTDTPTPTETPSETPTPSDTPTETPTPLDTETPTYTPTPNETPSETPTPTATPTSAPTSWNVIIDYAYDPLYRLTAADYSTGELFHYTYDAVGNRLTQETLAGTNEYAYDIANRLAEVDGVPYAWDANGNLLDDGLSQYSYDHANRLVTVEHPTGGYDFAYNGLGDRVTQDVSGSTINYALDLNTGLTQVLSDGTSAYLYGVGRIGEEQPGGWKYHLGDALGSVRQLLDAGGEVRLARAFEPFGSMLKSTGEAGSAYAFTGEQVDGTGLVYLRARYYASDLGRFLTADPLRQAAPGALSVNPWAYAVHNPVRNIDPTGLSPIKIWASAFIESSSINFPYVYYPKVWDPTYWESVYNVPVGAFALGVFDGDDRSFFEGGVRPSARVWHEIVVDSNPLASQPYSTSGTGKTRVAFLYLDPFGGRVGFGTAGAQAPAPPPATVDRSPDLCTVSVDINIYDSPESGTMPLGLPGLTPPIRYRYSLEFDFAEGIVTYLGQHSAYPWHELYIEGLSSPPERYVPDGPTRTGLDLDARIGGEKVISQESQQIPADPVAEALCSCGVPLSQEG